MQPLSRTAAQAAQPPQLGSRRQNETGGDEQPPTAVVPHVHFSDRHAAKLRVCAYIGVERAAGALFCALLCETRATVPSAPTPTIGSSAISGSSIDCWHRAAVALSGGAIEHRH